MMVISQIFASLVIHNEGGIFISYNHHDYYFNEMGTIFNNIVLILSSVFKHT